MRNPALHVSVQESATSSTLSFHTQDLQGKVALVTGASRGIGRAISLHLFSRGTSILATCSSLSSMCHIESLKEEAIRQYQDLNGNGIPKIVGVAANLLSPEFPAIIANKVRDAFNGKLNIIVSNANYVDFRSMGELDAEYVQKQLMGNVQSLVLLMDILFAKGYIQPKSRVINISSEASRTPLPFPCKTSDT
ncbi:3-oxoacyl-(acyl-carrier-) reductase [Fusarium albosuccineum]|uniref:3-oxoacyl-(Acyl-carrier-) reductase n=1 Tax=Fusarium albosuccineum TaxID=1237068 RepID=A0A8H4L2F1_9HYPO|nr:3-oxoacyl-(acyl-carrier-) reductase [Fusarium albosuccineum]